MKRICFYIVSVEVIVNEENNPSSSLSSLAKEITQRVLGGLGAFAVKITSDLETTKNDPAIYERENQDNPEDLNPEDLGHSEYPKNKPGI